jgi:hypothetical protein
MLICPDAAGLSGNRDPIAKVDKLGCGSSKVVWFNWRDDVAYRRRPSAKLLMSSVLRTGVSLIGNLGSIVKLSSVLALQQLTKICHSEIRCLSAGGINHKNVRAAVQASVNMS